MGCHLVSLHRMNSFHRKLLRKLLGIIWPHRISNEDLYKSYGVQPRHEVITNARWKLIGHVLRLPLDIPAQMAMTCYMKDSQMKRWRDKQRCNLPGMLRDDMKRNGMSMNSLHNLHNLRETAANRRRWHEYFYCGF